VRRQAAVELGQTENAASEPHLCRLLLDPEAQVRRAAAEALGRLADPWAAPALAQAVLDVDSGVSQAAIRALAPLGEEGLTALLAALRNQRVRTLAKVIEELAALPDPRAIEAVRGALHHTASSVRATAART